VKVHINSEQLNSVKLALTGIKNGYPKVMTRALNKTISGVRTDESKEVRADLNLKSAYVNAAITTQKASWTNLTARTDAKSKPVGLINFSGTKQNAKGVSVKVKKKNRRSTLKHAFIQTAKNAKNVFWREGKPRYPIDRLTGPRITDILAKKEIIGRVEDKAGVRLKTNIDYELTRVLKAL